MSAPPLPCRWDGESFAPLPRFGKLADQHFVIGQVYELVEHKERSSISHNHEFAWLKEAWLSLPESLSDHFPSTEHLRKRALITAGYFHESVIDAGTKAAALRVAAFARTKDEFAAIVVRGPIVVIREAKSQSRRSMDRAEFQASKTAIMEVVAEMLNVAPAELLRAAA